MLTKNAFQKMSKMFWCPKIVQIFAITHYIYKLLPACSLSLMYREKRTMQYRSLNCAPKAHRIENCVKFAVDNGLSKNCPRKYWVTDRSPNRNRTFLEQNFWTPIYTSSGYGPPRLLASPDHSCGRCQRPRIVHKALEVTPAELKV